MSKCCKPQTDTGGLDNALGDLVNAQIGLGKALLGALTAGSSVLLDGAKNMKLPKGGGCCDIPEPCWMPKSLGEVTCTLKPGDSGEICLTITNEDFRPHNYTIAAAGEDAGDVTIANPAFSLGPKERITVAVKVTMPQPSQKPGETAPPAASCCDCDCLDLLIWVRGCNAFYLRWVVCVGQTSKTCCHAVCVDDCPDYELHWYDHFHIFRPCPVAGGRELSNGLAQ
jgi:hypothetical protein